MPTLIRWENGAAFDAEDPFTTVADDQDMPRGDVIVSLSRFQAEGEQLLSQNRQVGVRILPDEAVEALAYDLPRIALVAPVFPSFRDGRAYTSARLLRQRFAYRGEVRAVGDVLREQAGFLIRCGFDAFSPVDGSSAANWNHVARRFRHVYQRAADHRVPAFEERQG